MDPRKELAERYDYPDATGHEDRGPLRMTLDRLLIDLAAERMTSARMIGRQTAILNTHAHDAVSGRAGSAMAAGQIAAHIGELNVLDQVINWLAAAAHRLYTDPQVVAAGLAGDTPQITPDALDRTTTAFRHLIDSPADEEHDQRRTQIILEAAAEPNRRTALLAAAQGGEVGVGLHASVPVIMGLVADGLGEAIHDQAERVIGFEINDRGRLEAGQLERDYQCTRRAGCVVHPDADREHLPMPVGG